MSEGMQDPELKQVLGALLFASKKPLTVAEIRAALRETAQNGEPATQAFGDVAPADLQAALDALCAEIASARLGLVLVEVAGAYRFQSDAIAGTWVRQLLKIDKPQRLSRPALETLAIIAYRQPISRAEIEAVRGVGVDAMIRHLLELQLIRMAGRSDLPGRPMLYGTTQFFLEHFGLSSVKNLPGVEQLSRRDRERARSSHTECEPDNGSGKEAPSAPAESELALDDGGRHDPETE